MTQFKQKWEVISSHMARRTFARRWYEKEGDLLMLSRYLGHSDMATTLKYIGAAPDEIQDEYERIF